MSKVYLQPNKFSGLLTLFLFKIITEFASYYPLICQEPSRLNKGVVNGMGFLLLFGQGSQKEESLHLKSIEYDLWLCNIENLVPQASHPFDLIYYKLTVGMQPQISNLCRDINHEPQTQFWSAFSFGGRN